MTPARNRSALRSAGVGMRRRCANDRRPPSSIYRGTDRLIADLERRPATPLIRNVMTELWRPRKKLPMDAPRGERPPSRGPSSCRNCIGQDGRMLQDGPDGSAAMRAPRATSRD
jgi:hypothetical protein